MPAQVKGQAEGPRPSASWAHAPSHPPPGLLGLQHWHGGRGSQGAKSPQPASAVPPARRVGTGTLNRPRHTPTSREQGAPGPRGVNPLPSSPPPPGSWGKRGFTPCLPALAPRTHKATWGSAPGPRLPGRHFTCAAAALLPPPPGGAERRALVAPPCSGRLQPLPAPPIWPGLRALSNPTRQSSSPRPAPSAGLPITGSVALPLAGLNTKGEEGSLLLKVSPLCVSGACDAGGGACGGRRNQASAKVLQTGALQNSKADALHVFCSREYGILSW